MTDVKDNSDRPPDSDFHQQNLKAWQPLLTPAWVIATFFVVGIIFVPIGVVIVDASNSVVEYSAQYDHLGPNPTITFNITTEMQPPVYFYYELSNFYQNHRRYVKSRSDTQLRGTRGLTEADLSSKCDPLFRWPEASGKLLYPCGLIANSYFNDTFALTTPGLTWADDKIAWDSDVREKFKPFEDFSNTTMTNIGPQNITLDHTKQDFMVWMRTAGLPTFKKLRYIINQTLQKDTTVTVVIGSAFDVKSFNGGKAVYLSTVSWLGGKNPFLGYAYIVVGSLCLLLAVAFAIKHRLSPRKLGDMRYFNWHGRVEVANQG